MVMLLIFTAIAGASNSVAMLTIFRFLAGVGGSGTLAVGAGTISDLWDMQAEGGKAALFYIMAPFLGPALGSFYSHNKSISCMEPKTSGIPPRRSYFPHRFPTPLNFICINYSANILERAINRRLYHRSIP